MKESRISTYFIKCVVIVLEFKIISVQCSPFKKSKRTCSFKCKMQISGELFSLPGQITSVIWIWNRITEKNLQIASAIPWQEFFAWQYIILKLYNCHIVCSFANALEIFLFFKWDKEIESPYSLLLVVNLFKTLIRYRPAFILIIAFFKATC